jgi:threonylcarbamoyladenosine tRNA methylthiotransferase MtaB
MNTFTINTLGCKVNQYETQQIRELLERFSLKQTNLDAGPDIVVINTCCVTHTASAKSRQCIRKAQKFNKNAIIVVAGCLPVAENAELGNRSDNIHIVTEKKQLANTLQNILEKHNSNQNPDHTYNKPAIDTKIKHKSDLLAANSTIIEKDSSENFQTLKAYEGQSRAFLKIQDGCDGYCSYCIIPKIRREISNKPAEDVLKEANDLVYAGHKEIVLTGIFLGAYGQDTVRRKKWDPQKTDQLADLLVQLAQIPGLDRIRLSSLEPGDVTDKLLSVFAKHKNIMPHLHLPLQSGSAPILRKMARQYTLDEFCATIEKLKNTLDRPAITTDIIVGFPGETDQDFQNTIQIAKDVKFSKIHVFSYSERQNTSAVNMLPKVDPAIIKQRAKKLRQLDEQLQKDFMQQFIGEKVSLILENSKVIQGRCERHFLVTAKTKQKTSKGQQLSGILQPDGTANCDI